MRYVAVGLAFGLAWAAMMAARVETDKPMVLVSAVVMCGLFGAALWAIRALVVRWRARGD